MRRLALLIAMSALLGACAHQTTCEATRTLYVVSHGWHSGVVVERAELAKRLPALAAEIGRDGLVEIGWGEERFYQAREPSVGMALAALLRPNASVLQVVPFRGAPRSYFAGSEVVEVRTDEAGYSAALAYLAASFEPELERLGRSLYGEGWFYRAEGSFHLFNTCNTWVAAVLKKAACSGS
jgi:uncharacterized protein (TIGR02117 family)